MPFSQQYLVEHTDNTEENTVLISGLQWLIKTEKKGNV